MRGSRAHRRDGTAPTRSLTFARTPGVGSRPSKLRVSIGQIWACMMSNGSSAGAGAARGRLGRLTSHLLPTAAPSPTATGHGLAPWEQYDAPPTTPLDIRLGLTKAEDINHKLRWGFVSASAIGSDWIKSLQDVPGAEFQGIWARDHEAGKRYAEKHGINVAHATYADLCNDPEVDIIYIASKTFDHHWQALEAIKAGKSVLVEKRK